MFFLAYGKLFNSPSEILDMPTAERRWYVERLERQMEFEKKQAEKK